MKNLRFQGILPIAAALILYFALVVSMQRHLGAPQAEFGGAEFPDEASHYVSGLMLHDYLAQGMPGSPLSYATNYYIHVPYFAVGYWPPMFYIAESLWMTCFGTARGQVLLLTALVSALIATLLFFSVRKMVGGLAAFGFGLLFLLAPVVEQSSNAIMTDLPVALGSFAAILALARYLDSERSADAILFGVLASATILTKSSGLVLGALPLAAVLLTGRFHLLRRFSFWLMGVVVVVMCGPWFLFTRNLISIGFVGIVKTFGESLLSLSLTVWHNLGLLLLLSLLGAWRLISRRPLGGLAAICLIQPVVAVLFFAISPTVNEPRYLIAAFAPLLVLAAAGFQAILEFTAGRFSHDRMVAPALMAILVVAAALGWLFHFPAIFPTPFRSVAEFVVSHPYSAVMVNADFEGPEIAQIAGMEPHRPPAVFLIRPNKVFAHVDWMGGNYVCRYRTPEEVETVLETLHIDLVILRKDPPPDAVLHERLLYQAIVQTFADKWRKVYSSSSNDYDYDLYEPVSKPVVSSSSLERSLHDLLAGRFLVAQ